MFQRSCFRWLFSIGFTKDRWRWRRIFAGAFVIGVLAVGALVGLVFYLDKPVAPTRLTKLAGVSLGQKENDVLFRKGQPAHTCNPGKDLTEFWYRVSVPGYSEVSWLQVLFRPGVGVTAIAFSGDLSLADQDRPPRIDRGQSVDNTIVQWGKPNRMVEGTSPTTRYYHWDKYNLLVAFEKNSAIAMGVHDAAKTQSVMESLSTSCAPN